MSDVARLAGVSIKTVSRVVNNERGVHTTTAERVIFAIGQLGFRRDLVARNLRQGRSTNTIGVVLEDLSNPFSSALTRAIEDVAREYGRHVLAGSSDDDVDRERDLALEFCARRVDGLLVVPAGPRHAYLVPEIRAGMHVVFVDSPVRDVVADAVLVDNVRGTADAVRHLAGYGHSRIAFLGDNPAIFTASERLRGFRAGCTLAGVRYDDGLVAMGPHNEKSVAAALDRLLAGPDGATAVVSGNNRITVMLIRVFAGRPHRPALVGFDDFELADLLNPPVTVVAYDTATLGKVAAETLFARIEGDESPTRQVLLPVHLVPRGSAEVRPH